MINQLKIKNFKSIVDADISFKKLNILCGENASGKTSIIHAILLCSQNCNNGKTIDGPIIKIGEYEELKNTEKYGEISIILENEKKEKKSIVYGRNKDPKLNQDNILTVNDSSNASFVFEKDIFYLSSNRTGVMDTYQKGNSLFGINGAETISFLFEHQNDLINQDYMTYFNKKIKNTGIAENRRFIEHVRYWMENITDEKISISSVDRTNQFILSFGDKKIRPINTGSGYSFLLPIVIVCLGVILLNNNSPTIIIENPEIFLHPEAQEKLMKFLGFCRKYCQIIIETHSQYIIKGTIENCKTDAKIIVANKNENGCTTLSTFKGEEFKTDSYLEVLYRAFGIIVPEFHILLYGLLQQKYNKSEKIFESSVMKFDKYLRELDGIERKEWVHKHLVNGVEKTDIYETLPSFIRNKIDHPEAINPSNNRIYNYTSSELEKSVAFLLDHL